MKRILATILTVCCCAISIHAEGLSDSNVATEDVIVPSQPVFQIAQNTPAGQSAAPAAGAPAHKSVATAAILSLVMPGAGNFYTGQKSKGAILMGIGIAGYVVAASSVSSSVNCTASGTSATCSSGSVTCTGTESYNGSSYSSSTNCSYGARLWGGLGMVWGASIYGLVSSIHRAEDINSGKVVALDRLHLSIPIGKKAGFQVAYNFKF